MESGFFCVLRLAFVATDCDHQLTIGATDCDHQLTIGATDCDHRRDRLRPIATIGATDCDHRRDRLRPIATIGATDCDRLRPSARPIATIGATDCDRLRPNRDRIGRPPPPFLGWRPALDPRSLNFFGLQCAFLQKSCFFALHCACKKGVWDCPPLLGGADRMS